MKRGLLRATTLTALMALTASAWLAGCELNSSPGGGTGVDGLTGIVVDGRGAPVAGARVRVYPASATSATLGKVAVAANATSATVATPDSTFTGADGRYRFKKLPAGTYNLEASIRSNDTAYAIFLRGIVFNKKLDLGVDTLQASGAMSLRVRGQGQAALEGALCEITGSPWAAISDSAGVCLFEELAPGTYPVVVRHANFTPASRELVVRSRWRTDGGEVYVGPEGGFASAAWRRVSIRGYDFYLPPGMELQWKRDGEDSLAYFSGSQMRLVVGTGMMATSWPWTGMPEISPEPLVIDASNRYPIRLALRGGPIQAHVPQVGATWTLLMRATVGVIEPAVDGFPILEFTGWASTRQGFDTLAKALATIRKWNGPGEAPGNPFPAPTLRSPARGAATEPDSVDFSWDAPVGTTIQYYRLQVSTTEDFASLIVNDSAARSPAQSSLVLGRTIGPFVADKTHFWRVAAIRPGDTTYSEWRSFLAVARPPKPMLSAPANGALAQGLSPVLSWLGPVHAEVTQYYRLELSTDSLMNGALLVNDSVTKTGSATSLRVGPLATGTRYFWRVKGIGGLGLSAVSQTRSFTTVAAAPGAALPSVPQLQEPSQYGNGLQVAWRFDDRTGTDYYHVQVAEDSLFTSLVASDSLAPGAGNAGQAAGIMAMTATGFKDDTKYYLRVWGVGPGGATASVKREFIYSEWIAKRSAR